MFFFYDLNRTIERKIKLYSKTQGLDIKNVKILVSYSGGVDSAVLLDIVSKLSGKYKFIFDFIYINHNMNPSDEIIELHSKKIANKYKTKFIYRKLQLHPDKNKEAQFRFLRYNCLKKIKSENNYNFIFTAHHFDDQLETLYMRSRGRFDWTNLLGIYESIDFIRRPMLNINKKSIFKYAIKNNVQWMFDYTNNDLKISRNNIRNNIFPNSSRFMFIYLYFLLISSRLNFYFFKNKISRNKSIIIKKTNNYTLIDKSSFLNLNNSYKKIFLQSILKKHNKGRYLNLNKGKWNNLWTYLSKNKNSSNFKLSEKIIINNSKDMIIAGNSNAYNNMHVQLKDDIVWEDFRFKVCQNSEAESLGVIDEDSIYISQNMMDKGVFIRNWTNGDCYLNSSNKKRRVSKLFIKNKFNNYQKMTQPLLVNSKDKIIWIPGLSKDCFESHMHKNNNCIKISREILN